MKNRFLFTFITIIIVYSCSKEDTPIDPKSDILGKWQISHLGNGSNPLPYENPISYREYLTDSVTRVFNYEEKQFYYEKYWIEDSFLFRTYLFIDAIDKDTTIFIEKYKFQFQNKNTLRLDFQEPAIYTTSIYERIN